MIPLREKFYTAENKMFLAVDCIIFGYEEGQIKLLVFKREVEPRAGEWSLIGSIINIDETPDAAAHRVLEEITGLKHVFLEQLSCFGQVDRDPGGRVVTVAYWSLIQSSGKQISVANHEAMWVPLDDIPDLVLDHNEIVDQAIAKLKNFARYRPIGFELLPERFTLPQLLKVYEAIYQRPIDDRNFRKKILSTGLLIKLDIKDKSTSKKGAYLYKFDHEKYQELSKNGYWFEI